MPFRKDLTSGKKGESLVCELLSKNGVGNTIVNLTGHDIEATLENTVFTLEVKYDLYAACSGNIAIEFYNPKSCKPSGLAATTANIWAYVLTDPHSIFFAKVIDLQAFILRVTPYKTITAGGDKNASLYLYKKEVILPGVFRQVDNLPTAEFINTVRGLL